MLSPPLKLGGHRLLFHWQGPPNQLTPRNLACGRRGQDVGESKRAGDHVHWKPFDTQQSKKSTQETTCARLAGAEISGTRHAPCDNPSIYESHRGSSNEVRRRQQRLLYLSQFDTTPTNLDHAIPTSNQFPALGPLHGNVPCAVDGPQCRPRIEKAFSCEVGPPQVAKTNLRSRDPELALLVHVADALRWIVARPSCEVQAGAIEHVAKKPRR
mmetsp:Transcript_14479/g.39638  ORF Transcript_14479/g.39638 Transcript_14479/m.39638 type:complete len:213 (+) Transcript_14479:1349-1987(+)